jgi:NodT family efflux transporter outer membrane factor (OMF) lipoprotein
MSLIIVLAGTGGCVVGPDYQPPQRPMPAAWASPATAPTTRASAATTRPAEVAQWWSKFNDPQLNALVERAIESNLDLRQAEARIRQARANRGVVSGRYWPQVDASGSYTRVGDGGGGTSAVVGPGGVITQAGAGSSERSLWRAGLDASWELDVFGGVRRSVEAADADIRFAIEDLRDVQVTLTSEVALAYLDLRNFQRQIDIARDNLRAQEQSASLTRRRQLGGFVSSLDLAQAEAQVATTRAQIPLLEQNARQAMYAIAVLLGLEPATLIDELSLTAPTLAIPGEIPIGLPSDLLLRRPDIRRAEANLEAANARVGAATADLFPRFSLTGSFGSQADQFKGLGNWSNTSWSFGPGVSWPVFSAGSIRANIAAQDALHEQALIGYEQTVLIALQDVESALIAFEKEQERRMALRDAVTSNRRAVDLATRLYTQGQTDFLNVLTAQRSLFASEESLVQSDRTVAANLVALYKALGGGWQPENSR